MITTLNCEQRSDEWYAARLGIVTASSIRKLVTPRTMTFANNDTSRGYVAQLVAERITGVTEPSPMTWQMERGVWDEPIARDLYADHEDLTVTECGLVIREWDNGLKMAASPDGLVGEHGLIEIKSRGPATQITHTASRDIPTDAHIQMQAQLLVTGRAWCDYVSYSPGLALWVERVYPDTDTQASLFAALETAEEEITILREDYERVTQGMLIAPPRDQEIIL